MEMTTDQILLFSILIVTISLFIYGRWRHDKVALFALLTSVFLGLVPSDVAFNGFGHPAVITVACVLILSTAVQRSGAINTLTKKIIPKKGGVGLSMIILTTVTAIFSGVMNNVGAMALMMPIAIQVAKKFNLPVGKFLMPVAFASIIGGMTTLIGTPPNLIVSGFRENETQSGFNMFDFAPVGLAVAFVGLLFIASIGWKLVPRREQARGKGFDTANYLAEVYVQENSVLAEKTLQKAGDLLDDDGAQILSVVRNGLRINAPHKSRKIRVDDILIIESEPAALGVILSNYDLKLVVTDRKNIKEENEEEEYLQEGDLKLVELAVLPDAAIIAQTAENIFMQERYGISLLALSRQGSHTVKRVSKTKIRAGDVLLVQGQEESVSSFSSEFSCVPLAERNIRIPDKRNAILSSLFMGIAIVGAAFGLIPAAISFALGVLGVMFFKVLPLRRIYSSIDWPVVVLLAALIPVAQAMTNTGAAELIANFFVDNFSGGSPAITLGIILVITMMLSDFMNNAATATVMCPIAISMAGILDVNVDAYLMAVAVGASCAFLTPIGHQNNTLILGPGGFKFNDYWKMGLPLEIIVVLIAVPALLYFWPL